MRMTGTRYLWLVCGLAVLTLDLAGSLAARYWGFAYGNLSAVSFLIYFCAGVGGGRLAGVRAGGTAGAVTALVDATAGWAMSSALGATAGSPSRLMGWEVVLVAAGVVFTGWVLGLVGGAVGKAVHRSVATDSKEYP
jgi:hypothetical protein